MCGISSGVGVAEECGAGTVLGVDGGEREVPPAVFAADCGRRVVAGADACENFDAAGGCKRDGASGAVISGAQFFDTTQTVAAVHHGGLSLWSMNRWPVALLAVWACGAGGCVDSLRARVVEGVCGEARGDPDFPDPQVRGTRGTDGCASAGDDCSDRAGSLWDFLGPCCCCRKESWNG